MKVMVDVCVIPIGVGTSLSKYVAECVKLFEARSLECHLHAYGTNVEGEWDDVFAAIKACHERLHEIGAPRVSTTLKLGTRNDRAQTLDDKVRSVREKLGDRE